MRRLMVAFVGLALPLGPSVTLASDEDTAVTGQFSPASSLTEARVDHTATPLPNGTTWTEVPSPWCVVDADTGPDGSVWILGPPGPLDTGIRLTVIRPEATASTE